MDQQVLDALGHTEVIDAEIEATCTEAGLSEGKHCSACDEVLVAQQTVAALGHTEVVDKAQAPTCTQTGLSEGKHCSTCNEVLVPQTIIDALEHDYPYGVCTRCGQEFYSNGLRFTSDGDGTCTVRGIGTCTDRELYIPKTSPDGDTVTYIDSSAFANCSNITSVVIPEGVIGIGGSAFQGCTSLVSIIVPDSVTGIGKGAFSGCSSLESMTLPFVGHSIGETQASKSTVFGYIFGDTKYTGGVSVYQYYGPSGTSHLSCTYYIPASL
jgi:hypothetical protein